MYTLSVTNANGCVGVDSVLVSVIDARIQQNDTSICLLESITLTHGLFESIPKTSLLAFWPLRGNAIDMGQNNPRFRISDLTAILAL